MIPVSLVDVVLRETTLDDGQVQKHYQLVLLDEAQRRALVIWIGEFEALAIAMKMSGQSFAARPMTQVFMARLIEASGATLERVEISALKETVFYATVYVQANGETRQIDARPSDAIGLALHVGAPLFVSEDVLAEAGIDIPQGHVPTGKGLSEVQQILDGLKSAEAAVKARVEKDPQAAPWSGAEEEDQILLAKVFAEPGG